MERYLAKFIKKDVHKKIVLLSGPRQVGKTWLSRNLFPESEVVYLNYDRSSDREVIRREIWDRHATLVIFDELHKMKTWKSWIKGIYDTEGTDPGLLITGSAQFDAFRKGGRESLAGRHFLYRLHPLSVAELKATCDPQEAMDRLLERGGFPEPYMADLVIDAARWRRSHLDSILREDLRDLIVIQDLRSLEYLVDRLAAQVGSPVSYQSLAEDIGVSAPTIKRWIQALEAMYVVFTIHPWSRKVKGSILKQPKIFFYDTARIPADNESARFENLTACALLKHLHFAEDTRGENCNLSYLRDKQKHEIDFLIVKDNMPVQMIECKLSATEKHNFAKFQQIKPKKISVLLCRDALRNESHGDWELRQAAPWLAALEE
jgi:predicted AAA+ superfamily ATPase